MNYKVSVIVPVYKVEPYLDRCIQSIVNQTYTNLEIILVDDGSPDNSPAMCDEWAKKDSRIVVIHKDNGGLSSARNAGVDTATGEYISFIDSDDYVDVDMIHSMLNYALDNNLSVVCCGRYRVSGDNKNEMFNLSSDTICTGEEAIKQILIGGFIEEAAWDKIYHKSIFKNRRFPLGEINEDIVQTINILGSCDNVGHIGKSYYYYCENQNSITTSKYTPKKKVCLKHLDEIKLYLNTYYPHLLKYYYFLETRYCQGLLYLLLDNREIFNKYRIDYNEVYTRFKKSFIKSQFGKVYSISERIKGLLIYLKLYYWIHLIK